jgi:hypothetical protein
LASRYVEPLLTHLCHQTRPVVVGSGFHTACISAGCSRLVLSLHSWSDENKRRMSAQSRDSTNKFPNSQHSRSASNASSQVHSLPQPEYELIVRPAPHIESSRRAPLRRFDSNSSATGLLPHTATPEMHSTLPNIEPPSFPERMWSNFPGSYARQPQSLSRPPRSSSLYSPGKVPSYQWDGSMERGGPLLEVDDPEWRSNRVSGEEEGRVPINSHGRYNVI